MTHQQATSFKDLFADGGEMGALMRTLDWSATAIGAVENWSESLRTSVSICLTSQFPIMILWGPELVMLYNDAYRPILGATKHPKAMGQRLSECGSDWDTIRPMVEGVLSTGKATCSNNQLLLLDRNGYIEECYFTFSYSPILDETGNVVAVFTAVTETTKQVLDERRLLTLRELAAKTSVAKTAIDACKISAQTLAVNSADIPFALLYMIDEAGQAQLKGATGISPGTPASPLLVDLQEEDGGMWPLAKVVRTGETQQVDNLAARFGLSHTTSVPHSALVLPLAQGLLERPAGLLIVGISPKRALDEEYCGFLELIAELISTAIAKACAYVDHYERQRTQEALRQSQERLHVALKNSPVIVFNQDLELRYTWEYNPGFEHEAEAIVGKRDADLLTSDEAEVLTQIKRRVLETGVGTRQEVKITVLGKDCYYDLTVEPLRDGNNEIIGVTCAAVDICERKQAEMALRKSETLLNALLAGAPIGIAFLDSDLRYIHANQALATINGLPLSEHLGRTLGEVLPAWLPRLAPIFQQVMETKEPLLNHYVSGETNPPGVYRHSLVNFYPVCLPDGQMLGVGVTSMEITELKRIEQALRESESRFRRMADGAPVFIWVSGTDGHCTYFNQPWLDFVGQTLEEALAKCWSEGIHPDDKESCLNAYKRAFNARERFQIEYRHRRQDGEYRWLLYEGVPLIDGSFLGYISSGVDISDRKATEAEREQLLAREQAARAEAEAANRIKDEFLAVLSHELRSPLNPILGWAKLLKTGKFDRKATDRALDTIERNAKLQAQLIEDLLDVSRILRGKMVLNVSPVNLVTTIEAALETVRLAAQAKAIQIQTLLDSNVGRVSGDINRLQQVVWNLVSNAVKFTPTGGLVEVRLARDGNNAQIQVKDTGKGISPEFLPYVFEYFRQENSTTTRKFGGLGLGLAIVRYLTELHGGSVKAESLGEGLGATFTVRLPLMEVASDVTEEVQTQAGADLSGLRVLIVDDEADIRELVAFILEQSGAEVTVTKSASEALLALQQSVLDVLLSDIGMPDVDGYMLMGQVRALSPERGGQIPAIALTAYAGEYNERLARSAGFQMHISKPVEPFELVRAIASLVGR